MFVIVDPVNSSNNTARNSYRTPDILKKFQEAHTHLKSLIQGEYLRLVRLRNEQQEQSVLTALEAPVVDSEAL